MPPGLSLQSSILLPHERGLSFLGGWGWLPLPARSQYEQKYVTGFPGRATVTSEVWKEIAVRLWALGGSYKHRGLRLPPGFRAGGATEDKMACNLDSLSRRLAHAGLLSAACSAPSSPDPGYAGKGWEGRSIKE